VQFVLSKGALPLCLCLCLNILPTAAVNSHPYSTFQRAGINGGAFCYPHLAPTVPAIPCKPDKFAPLPFHVNRTNAFAFAFASASAFALIYCLLKTAAVQTHRRAFRFSESPLRCDLYNHVIPEFKEPDAGFLFQPVKQPVTEFQPDFMQVNIHFPV
jgi:hypothetical protein